MSIRLGLVLLLLLPVAVQAVDGPPSADEIRAAGGSASKLIPLLTHWLDAYPDSARSWPADDVAFVVAHLVGLGQHHHPNTAAVAEAYARRRAEEAPMRLDHTAEALSLAARIRLRLGQNQAALDLLDQGRKLCRREIRSESEATYCAFLLRDRALADMRSSLYDEAARDLDQAMRRLEPYPSSPAWVAVLNSAADLACLRGEADSCLERYHRAIEVAEAQHGVDSEVAAYGYLGVGWAAALAGEWGTARASFERAERVWSRHLGSDHPRLADALIEYGELLRRAGDAPAAVDVLRRAVGLRESRLGPSAFDLPRALDALGQAHLDLGELTPARRALERSAAIRRQHLDEDHVDHARSLTGLARLAQARGNETDARRLLTRAIEARQRAHRRQGGAAGDPPALAEAYASLAELYIDTRPELALDLAAQAKDALAAAYGEDHPDVARAWWIEARAHLAAGSDAIPSALESEAIGRSHLRRVAAGFSERDLLDSAAARPRGTDVALEALFAFSAPRADRIKAVWQEVARSRGEVFDVLIERRRRASPTGELNVARQALARLLVAGSGYDPTDYARRLAIARDRVARAERSLSIGFESLPGRRPGLREILARLTLGETLVAYRIFSSRSGRRLAAFVAAGERVAVYDLGLWEGVEDDLRGLRRAFDGVSEGEYRRFGVGLRQKVWDPVEPWLIRARRVFVVPDGPLFLVPFAALPTTDGYLVEKGPSFHVLGTERDLAAARVMKPMEGQLLLVGDPDFGEPSPASLNRSVPTDFAALPGAREEALAVAEAWRRWVPGGEVRWLRGSEATEGRWRRDAIGAVALHLATHGFFISPARRGGAPRTVSETRGVGGLVRAERTSWSSLSGFALAQANRPSTGDGRNDGVVTREEIEQLNLSDARLVVLSFCDSGLGETRTGEGIFGLTRAFRGAGAGSLVLALGPVSDRGSKQFMERFYAALLGDGLDVDQAVRQASLELLESRRRSGSDAHPFHWGAFVSWGI